MYDGLDQIIVSAGLAKPKKDIFQDIDIKYVYYIIFYWLTRHMRL